MRIHLLSIGRRMPGWVGQGYQEYTKRLPPECALQLREIEPAHRGRSLSPEQARTREGQQILKALPKGVAVVALDVTGHPWSTEQLAVQLSDWMADGRDRALLVGGPEGLDGECLKRAERRWSLSPLTFPHPLVRVIVAEQIYRAWTVLQGHPYHRGGHA